LRFVILRFFVPYKHEKVISTPSQSIVSHRRDNILHLQYFTNNKMVNYKITYFNLRGRAELARLVLHQAGVSFEDYRFGPGEWPTAKPSKFIILFNFIHFFKKFYLLIQMFICIIDMPFGQVPVLEEDGKMLAQSITIARYLARQHGLAGIFKNHILTQIINTIIT